MTTNELNGKDFAKAASLCGWSLLMYFALSNLFQLVGLVIYSVATHCPVDEMDKNAELIIGVVCILMAFVLTFFVLFGKRFWPVVRGKWFFDDRTVTGVKLGLPLVCTANIAGTVIFATVSAVAEVGGIGYNTEILEIEYEGIGLAVDLFYSCLIAPFVEELIYRGFILGTLKPYGTKTAVIASALVFAVMHGVFVQMPLAFFAGLALGAVAVYTGSIVPSVIIHILYNTFAKSSDFIGADNIKGMAMFLSVLLTLTLAGSVIFFVKYRKFDKLWQEENTRVLRFMAKPGIILFTVLNLAVACMFIEKI